LRCRKLVVALIAAVGACARGRDGSSGTADGIHISLAPAASTHRARVIVTGIDRPSLSALRTAPPSGAPWDSLFRVAVATDAPAMAGRYVATDTSLEFEPLFPLDAGRNYFVRVDSKHLATPRLQPPVTAVVRLPKEERAPSTTVARILPTNPELPENQLRLYIEFSAPMSRQSGVDFVHLVDDRGKEVQYAFLPLDADFWNPDHTRYTLFLDPGRVKRGILPNEQMGRPLKAGRAYSLVIDSAWQDANGLPLAKPFRYRFRAGAAVERGIDLAAWRVAPPRAGTRDTLAIAFPRSLDHGLLQRAIGVERNGEPVPGDIAIGAAEKQWGFTPRESWRSGDYRLVVLSILEDVAGNRVGRPFEVDMFERVDSTALPERHTIPFKIR
jgi:hypothetical protein